MGAVVAVENEGERVRTMSDSDAISKHSKGVKRLVEAMREQLIHEYCSRIDEAVIKATTDGLFSTRVSIPDSFPPEALEWLRSHYPPFTFEMHPGLDETDKKEIVVSWPTILE